jgi:V/A-type H+/Na+-transporting ATPase subunit I
MPFTPARMKHVDLIVLRKDVRNVTAALGQLGAIQLAVVKPGHTTPQVVRAAPVPELERWRALLRRLDLLVEKLNLEHLPSAVGNLHEPIEGVESQLAAMEARTNDALLERAKLETEGAEIQDSLAKLAALEGIAAPLARLVDSPFLHFALGTMSLRDFGALQTATHGNTLLLTAPAEGSKVRVAAITSHKGRYALDSLLRNHNFSWEDVTQLPKGPPFEAAAGLQDRLDAIRERQRELSSLLRAIGGESVSEISRSYGRLRLELALAEAQANFGETRDTCMISGWAPADTVGSLSALLLCETQGRVVVQMQEPREADPELEEVPTLMANARFFRPFEMLVTALGMPRYNEVDPTPFLAVTFLLMYGAMFGDVGQGAVLAFLGLSAYLFLRAPALRSIGLVVTYAGISAVVFGFLFGSLFGSEEALPHVFRALFGESIAYPIVQPMRDAMMVLAVAVAFGVGFLSLGIVFNVINRLRTGDWLHAVLDHFGLAGIVFYWGSLGLGIKYAHRAESVTTAQVIILIALPLAAPCFRELIVVAFSSKRHMPRQVLGAMMHDGMIAAESVITYLSNTVSFARVGAFALSHAGLMIAVFSLAEIVRSLPGGSFWGCAVLILGNVLVIALEGLVVFVQCLRLEYYEFFSKFFDGTGRKYAPFRIG